MIQSKITDIAHTTHGVCLRKKMIHNWVDVLFVSKAPFYHDKKNHEL